MNEQGRYSGNKKQFIIIMVVLFAIVFTVITSSYIIFNELEAQLEQNIEDVASQNSLALHNKIHSNYELLLSLSEKMHGVTPENVEEVMESFDIFIVKYHLKRFAYVFPDGTCYSTDGGVANLSYREFFQRGMEGKATISGVLEDALEGSHGLVNVMSIPIKDENGQVEGVFGLTYYSKKFNNALQIECFDGQGYSCAINSEGQIMVAMGNDFLQMSENIFTDVLGKDKKNTEEIEVLKKQMTKNKSQGGIVYLPEKSYYHLAPVDLIGGDMTWYMVTIVPADVLGTRAAPIQNSLYLMAVIVVICILVGITIAIYYSKEQRKRTFRQAYVDPITKGPNYARFCLEMNQKRNRNGYLISMDITNFNTINIAAGKGVGDSMIETVWQIVLNKLQSEELAGHIGEDVFCLFLSAQEKERLLERLTQISDQINKKARSIQVRGIHARYGIYEVTDDEELESAYSKAQIAREYARSQIESEIVFYHEMDHEQLSQNRHLEERFEDSLSNREFEVWYQPKYSAATGDIVGSEALVRWRNSDGSLISPGIFIPLFEKNGMIAKLDEYMFRAVCRQQAEWLKNGYHVYPVSVNLSRASLYHSDIVEKYLDIIQEYEIDPKLIQIEITESALEGRTSIRQMLEQFRTLGIQILMDDFGTGYSSLATLNMKCFDTLKLDKSLVDHIGEENGETLLYYVINMGQKLGLHITAEGVENNMQLDFLKENHCDDIQGFLLAKPMPSQEFEAILS